MRANPQNSENLLTFTKQNLHGKLHFLCSESSIIDVLFSHLIHGHIALLRSLPGLVSVKEGNFILDFSNVHLTGFLPKVSLILKY